MLDQWSSFASSRQETLTQESGQSQTISSGLAIERELTSGQVHVYQIKLTADEYVRVRVDERGIDVVLTLLAPDRTPLADSHATRGSGDANAVAIVAEDSGTYWLEVQALRKDAAAGRYEVRLVEQRLATEREKKQFAAEKVYREGVSLNTKGTAEERRLGIVKMEQAVSLWRETEDRKGEIKALTAIGYAYEWFGELQTANLCYQRATQIAQILGDLRGEANMRFTMGRIHFLTGERQEALNAFHRAGQLFQQTSARLGEALVLASTGTVYLALGDLPRALEYHERALPVFSSLGHTANESVSHTHLGVIRTRMGERQKGLDAFNRALAIVRKIGFPSQEVRILRHLGDFHASAGDRRQALDFYTQGLKIAEAGGFRIDEAILLGAIGDVAFLDGDGGKALEFLDRALAGFRSIGDRENQTLTLQSQARVNAANGKLIEARGQIEAALGLKESLRSPVIDRELRITTAASMQSGYELYVYVLARLHEINPAGGFDALALEASERARARGLLEMLIESGADIRQGVSPDLLALEQSLQRQINAMAATRARVTDKAQAAVLDREISQLASRYLEVKAEIRATSPRYAALSQPQPLSAAGIQALLDEETVLLEFALGEGRSRLWAVTRKEIDGHPLSPRSDIESAAREVYDLLTARQPKSGMTESEALAHIADADAKLQTAAQSLSGMLLGPIADQLRGEWRGKRLAIVASGALHYLPFAALPAPETGRPVAPSSGRPIPLISRHEIVYLPSASVLALIRSETSGRAPAPGAVAVLADPVFEANDPRLLAVAKRKAGDRDVAVNVRSVGEAPAPPPLSNDSPLMSAIRGMDRGALGRLPFSREEADAIAGLVSAGSLLKATGFRASRAMAVSGELSRYRIVHFATHGVLNSRQPDLSGLVLSLVDETGEPQDGFLRMNEIYNLRLPADLVTLSACQTALGKEIRGEGLVGLTRGFMYAGAQRVVASLWQVDDLATAHLMQHFYRGMLKEGLRPAAALRAAQIEMAKQKRWASPYYWAGFVLQGEWR
jgi:CHAT domain-containing protein